MVPEQVHAGGASAARASAARRTMQALSGGVDVFEEFFESVRIGLALADLSAAYVRVNATYADLLGRAPEDLIGVPFPEVVPAGAFSDLETRLARVLAGDEPALTSEERYVGLDGRELWVLHGLNLVRDEHGAPGWLALSAQDVTERRRAEQDLRDLTATLAERAVRDPLTGLANRVLLEERTRSALARDARTGGSTGLLFLDLDRFKDVNDKHGHAVGDEVLRTVAHRLTQVVRPSDTVSRLGGDEFVVLAEGTAAAGLDHVVARLRETVAEPVQVGHLSLEVGVSVGVAISHRGEADPASLLTEADRDMYAAKRRAR